MDYGLLASLFWFLLGLLGFSLACIEIFAPASADRIEEHIRQLIATLAVAWIVLDTLVVDGRWAPKGRHPADRILTALLALLIGIVILVLGLPVRSLIYIAIIGALVFVLSRFDSLMHRLYIFAPGREIGALGLLIGFPSIIRDLLELVLTLSPG